MANRLKQEKSPYLMQHGENPVDWYPWCEEAFHKAVKEDKPIFLSIGYSTCHWCHVMAHESFEDLEMADLLNREFISIKADREERPDIDAVYMSVCQAMTGSGGWPLTIFMTPEQKPFFAGTYFPKHGGYGRFGIMELLERVADLWKNNREELLRAGNQITAAINQNQTGNGQKPNRQLVERAYCQLAQRFDHKWGGFGGAPKFPTPHNLLFLMRYADSIPRAKKPMEGHLIPALSHADRGLTFLNTDKLICVRMQFQTDFTAKGDAHHGQLQVIPGPNRSTKVMVMTGCLFHICGEGNRTRIGCITAAATRYRIG